MEIEAKSFGELLVVQVQLDQDSEEKIEHASNHTEVATTAERKSVNEIVVAC